MSRTQTSIQPRRACDQSVDGSGAGIRARRSAPSHRIRLWWIPAILAVALSTLASFALWTSHAAEGGVITTGNFAFSLGTLDWTSPTLSQSGRGAASLAPIRLGDGDVLVLTQNITANFAGDNLQVQLGIDWPTLPPGTTTTWHVSDASGSQVAPATGEAPMTQALTPPGIVQRASITWQVVVTIEMPAGINSYQSPNATPSSTPLPLGSLIISADQVRR